MMLFIHGALIYRNSHFSFDSPPPLSNQKIVVYFFFFFFGFTYFVVYSIQSFVPFFSIQFLLHSRQAFYRLLFISCPYIHVLVLILPFCVTLLYMQHNNVSPSLISITMVTSYTRNIRTPYCYKCAAQANILVHLGTTVI